MDSIKAVWVLTREVATLRDDNLELREWNAILEGQLDSYKRKSSLHKKKSELLYQIMKMMAYLQNSRSENISKRAKRFIERYNLIKKELNEKPFIPWSTGYTKSSEEE